MNLGIFGGTFNPIHKGHIKASLMFYDDAKLDKLLVIPDRIPPHKDGDVASAYHRLNMLHAVYDDKSVTGDRNIEISETELQREGKSYTIITLTELRKEYPDAKLYLYTGSDMFYTLESWFKGTEILSMCAVYTAAREENEQDKISEYAAKYNKAYGTECIIGKYEPVVSSSTAIRDCLNGKNDKNSCYFTNNLLTDSVNRYIMENGLYQSNDVFDYDAAYKKVLNDLPGLVNEKRLAHILSVVKCAEALSFFFKELGEDIDPKKVKFAAILHDVTKCMDQESLCRKYNIVLSKDDFDSMQTVHAITGAYYAKDVYSADNEVFLAVMNHTVGSENMSLMEKIIFVSDYCEETRTHEQCRISRNALTEMMERHKTQDLLSARKSAIRDFDYITAEILGKTLFYLKNSNCNIHGNTIKSFKAFISKYKDDKGFRQLSEKYLITD